MLALPFLTGCWDRLEIEDRAVVLGISVDAEKPEAIAEEDETTHKADAPAVAGKEMVRVAVQIALPGRIPLGPGEGGGGATNAQRTVWVIDVVGHSIDDAVMNLQQQLSSRLFFGHLRVIVVSEEVAKKGISNINDYFHRNSEVRRMAWLLIAKGSAKALMTAAPQLERVPTLYLMSTLDEAIGMGKFPIDFIGMFWSRSAKKGQEGFLPYVELKKHQNVEIKGIAYFRSDQMVGKSDPIGIGVYMVVKGINPAGYRVLIQIPGTNKEVTTAATHRKSKIDVAIKNGRPVFVVTAAIEINFEEKISGDLLINDMKTIKTIERLQSRQTEQAVEDFIKQTQRVGSDIFGFGEYVRAKKPAYWNRNIKTTEKWQNMYKDVSVEVHLDVRIRRIGMKSQ